MTVNYQYGCYDPACVAASGEVRVVEYHERDSQVCNFCGSPMYRAEPTNVVILTPNMDNTFERYRAWMGGCIDKALMLDPLDFRPHVGQVAHWENASHIVQLEGE